MHAIGRRDIRLVHAGIRHDETEPVLHDDQVRPATHDAGGSPQHDFNDRGSLPTSVRQLRSPRATG